MSKEESEARAWSLRVQSPEIFAYSIIPRADGKEVLEAALVMVNG